MDRVVLCMRWGTLYGPEYVNVLFGAVRAYLPGPARFVCLTDDSSGIRPEVECLPIPDLGLPDDMWRVGAWPKIALFRRDLYGLRGRALFVDLDMIPCGDLSVFFTHGQGLMAVDEAPWRTGLLSRTSPPETMSALMAFDLGSLGHLEEKLRAAPRVVADRYGLEQRYIHHEADVHGYWPAEWVVSFKRHLRRAPGIDRLLAPRQPPAGARMVAFHGRPRPADLVHRSPGNRDRWPHHLGAPVAWVAEHWHRHGTDPSAL
ncbi:hypothetical protein [Rhodobaculum claviforme]|uniref:Glycosyltransferase n=1 Tax=Rhodobaculum claviforme TaxID=1549854 RepID=A0A934TKV6_9RHOB|nr:hypothetical protein [Rhodobaculum claviforme]MBK5927311.1 hypothetical protein [Rhodobaculum claviforme]